MCVCMWRYWGNVSITGKRYKRGKTIPIFVFCTILCWFDGMETSRSAQNDETHKSVFFWLCSKKQWNTSPKLCSTFHKTLTTRSIFQLRPSAQCFRKCRLALFLMSSNFFFHSRFNFQVVILKCSIVCFFGSLQTAVIIYNPFIKIKLWLFSIK